MVLSWRGGKLLSCMNGHCTALSSAQKVSNQAQAFSAICFEVSLPQGYMPPPVRFSHDWDDHKTDAANAALEHMRST